MDSLSNQTKQIGVKDKQMVKKWKRNETGGCADNQTSPRRIGGSSKRDAIQVPAREKKQGGHAVQGRKGEGGITRQRIVLSKGKPRKAAEAIGIVSPKRGGVGVFRGKGAELGEGRRRAAEEGLKILKRRMFLCETTTVGKAKRRPSTKF